MENLNGAVRLWPHQRRGYEEVLAHIAARRVKRILLTSPTGGGKTLTTAMILRAHLMEGRRCVLFTNRRMMLEQVGKAMTGFGFSYGVRAAGEFPDGSEPLQIASVQTEASRVNRRKTWKPLPGTELIVFDEAHLHNNPQSNAVRKAYREENPNLVEVGVTATPIGLGDLYDALVVAGTTSELRACGALVPVYHYGVDEPDMKNVKKYVVGEDISETDQRKLIMVPGVHARVIEWFRRINPMGHPSVGFAPGVPESLGFAEAFVAAGIAAAHIDGDHIWVNGVLRPSTSESRDELLRMSREGAVRIVWNRFVLREAIDMPWLRHGVFACVFGSLQSQLQAGGRLLRSYPGVTSVTLQDHGGNWWRHGSLNSDRQWRLSDTANSVSHLAQEALFPPTDTGEPKPFLCHNCRVVIKLARGQTQATCACGARVDFTKRSRPVMQADGALIEHEGDPVKPRRTQVKPDTQVRWERIYWRAKKTGMTFSQAAGLFFHENGYFPPRTLPLMPRQPWQWFLGADKVPYADLYPKGDEK
jgi:superfamily II DNA or RNA helicase